MFFFIMLIIFAITFVAGIVLMIMEKINKTTYDAAEAIIGAPMIFSFFMALLCLC